MPYVPYVYNYQCFYIRKLRTAGFQFFYAVTKRTKNRQQTKNQLKLARNAFEAVKPNFGPLKMFDCTFVEQR